MKTMGQLVEATGIPERTIREYSRKHVIPDGDETGSYSESVVVYLLAVARLRGEGVRKHIVFRRRIAAMSDEELERFAHEPHETDALDDQAPVEVAAPVLPPATAAAVMPHAETREPPARRPEIRRHENWTRIVLRPGLELHVRSGVDEDVQRLAGEIDAIWERSIDADLDAEAEDEAEPKRKNDLRR